MPKIFPFRIGFVYHPQDDFYENSHFFYHPKEDIGVNLGYFHIIPRMIWLRSGFLTEFRGVSWVSEKILEKVLSKEYIIKRRRFMDIVILDSAYKHGITEESILACLFNTRGDEILDDPPPKRLVAGFDHLGRAIELIVIEDEVRNKIVVIHAMKLQKKYNYLLRDN